jgi:hypothetical protein
LSLDFVVHLDELGLLDGEFGFDLGFLEPLAAP